jgi:hypothetical protein
VCNFKPGRSMVAEVLGCWPVTSVGLMRGPTAETKVCWWHGVLVHITLSHHVYRSLLVNFV